MDEIQLQIEKLVKGIMIRFNDVPEFQEEEAEYYVSESKELHGYNENQLIPRNRERLVLLYAMSEIATVIAFKSAHYFKFTDGEESVDKTKVAHNYRLIARDYRADYNKEKAKLTGSIFRIANRADRP